MLTNRNDFSSDSFSVGLHSRISLLQRHFISSRSDVRWTDGSWEKQRSQTTEEGVDLDARNEGEE